MADGSEQILLRYDLNLLAEAVGDADIANQIKGVRFRLVLVNDYKVEITSDAQTNAEAQPVFLLVAKPRATSKTARTGPRSSSTTAYPRRTKSPVSPWR